MSMSMSNNSSRTSDATSDDTTVDHHEGPISQTMDRHGHLYIQFNETLGPYERVPLTNKANVYIILFFHSWIPNTENIKIVFVLWLILIMTMGIMGYLLR